MSIVRWLNILLTILAQYLAAVFILNPNHTYFEILTNPKLHLMTFASAFIIAGGYIINNFYDLEKDLINRPEKTLFGRVVSRNFCLNCYFLFNLLGLAISALASWRILIFYLFFAIALWAYSHKFQKIPLLREISASLLSVTSFFSIGIFYHYITIPLFIYGCFAMLIIFSREILKGIEAHKGNAIFGYGTLATWMGIKKSAAAIILINFMAMIPLLLLVVNHHFIPFAWFFIFATLAVNGIIFFKIYKIGLNPFVETIHTLYKIYLVLIIGLVIFIP